MNQRRNLQSLLSERPLSEETLLQLAPVMPHGALLNAMRFSKPTSRLVEAACLSQRYVHLGSPASPAEDYRTLAAASDLVALALALSEPQALLDSNCELLYVAWLLSGPLVAPDASELYTHLFNKTRDVATAETSASLLRLGVVFERLLYDLERGNVAALTKIKNTLASSHGPLTGRVIDPSWRHTVSTLDESERDIYAELVFSRLGDDPYAWLLAHHFAEAWSASLGELCDTVHLLTESK